MQLSIIAVGRLRNRALRALMDDYLGRIRRYAGCDEIELKELPARGFEDRIGRARDPRARTVLLQIEGKRYSSQGVASLIGQVRDAGERLQFLIGGSYGLPPSVCAPGDMSMSLSDMTMPHQLARVVLAEQLYRGFTILRGEPYSH